MILTLPIAFIAGLATFLSPCILPLVPGYLAVMTGGNRGKVVRRVIFFSLGIGLVFILLGILISLLSGFLIPVKDLTIKFIGLVLILFGFNLIYPLPFNFLKRQWRFTPRIKDAEDISSFLLGGAFGIGWTPCSGVVLGAILAQGFLLPNFSSVPLLFAYSLGIIVPMIVISLIYDRLGRLIMLPSNWLRFYSPVIGGLIIIFGLLLLTGLINYWPSRILFNLPG
jgi:cytochrome c-type biogenesis protein